jgi:hypothetical protein
MIPQGDADLDDDAPLFGTDDFRMFQMKVSLSCTPACSVPCRRLVQTQCVWPGTRVDAVALGSNGLCAVLPQIQPCAKRFVHDWVTCPFSHPGEKAKRRDPRYFVYTGIACPSMKKVRAELRSPMSEYIVTVC